MFTSSVCLRAEKTNSSCCPNRKLQDLHQKEWQELLVENPKSRRTNTEIRARGDLTELTWWFTERFTCNRGEHKTRTYTNRLQTKILQTEVKTGPSSDINNKTMNSTSASEEKTGSRQHTWLYYDHLKSAKVEQPLINSFETLKK